MSEPVGLPKYMGLIEAAEFLRVSKQTLSNWRKRRGDFPEPIADLKMGPVWLTKNLLDWSCAEGLKAERALAGDKAKATVGPAGGGGDAK